MPNSIIVTIITTSITTVSPPISRYSPFPKTPKSFNHFQTNPLKLHFSNIPSQLIISRPLKVTSSSNNPNSESKHQKSELKQAFHSAESIQQMIKAFNDFETYCDDDDVDLGLASAKLAEKLYDDDDSDPELVLSFGNKASVILTRFENDFSYYSFDDNDYDLFFTVLGNLWVTGLACVKLEMYDESLGYFHRASKIGDATYSAFNVVGGDDWNAVLSALWKVENELASVKMKMCMPDEGVVPHFRKGTDIQAMFSDLYDVDYGRSCFNLCVGYFRLLEFEEALPFGLEAVKIFRKNYGEGSLEVAEAVRFLAAIYGFVGDHGKVREQIQVRLNILKNFTPSSFDLVGIITYEVALVRHKETVAVVTAMASLNFAQAYFHQGLFAVAKLFAEACGVRFAKEEDRMSYGGYAVAIFNELSIFYEDIYERETALSYLEKLMMMTENKKFPLKLLSNVAARYFLLICRTGMVKNGVPYLEVVVQSLKERFGSKHFEVGNVYLHLGFAHSILREPETAEKLFTDAKEIMDASVGPHHEKAIQACQGLFSVYESMGRYTQAIEIQEMVIERLKGKEPREQDELDAAVRLLDDTKEKAGL